MLAFTVYLIVKIQVQAFPSISTFYKAFIQALLSCNKLKKKKLLMKALLWIEYFCSNIHKRGTLFDSGHEKYTIYQVEIEINTKKISKSKSCD